MIKLKEIRKARGMTQAELAENEEDFVKAMMVYGEAQDAIAELLEQYRANGYAEDSDEVLRLANMGYDYAHKQLGDYDELQERLIDALNALTEETEKAIDEELAALAEQLGGKEVTVGGWARTIRDMKTFGFIELNDGSCFKNLQIVMEAGQLDNYKEIALLRDIGGLSYDEISQTLDIEVGTGKSRLSRAWMTWLLSGSETTGSSPQRNNPLILPSIAAGNTSVDVIPGFGFSFTPQASSNFFNTSGLVTF